MLEEIMKKLKIGVLGCASIADRMMLPAIQASGVFELAAVSSRSAEKAKAFAAKFGAEPVTGYEALLNREEIDALYIPLPPGLHHEWTVKALKKGKHCLIEKPLALDFSSAQQLVETARGNNLSLFENFAFVYHSQHRFIRDRLERGDVGEIRCFRSSFGFPPLPADNFRYDQSLGGGALLDAGVYPLQASRLILGENSKLHVTAASLKTDPEKLVDIYGGAFLTGEAGVFSQIAFGFDNFYQCNYEVWGSRGKIRAERAFTAGPGIKPRVIIEKQGDYQEYLLPADNQFVNLLKAFHNSVTGGNFECHYRDILCQAQLIQEVLDHAGKGK